MGVNLDVTLEEVHRLKAFVNRVLRTIVGCTGEEVAGDWRKLHSEELHDICCSTNIIRVINQRGSDGLDMWHVWGKGGRIQGLVGKPEGKRTL
jgi:hypothetical protein